MLEDFRKQLKGDDIVITDLRATSPENRHSSC
jgi:hypothetical protein